MKRSPGKGRDAGGSGDMAPSANATLSTRMRERQRRPRPVKVVPERRGAKRSGAGVGPHALEDVRSSAAFTMRSKNPAAPTVIAASAPRQRRASQHRSRNNWRIAMPYFDRNER